MLTKVPFVITLGRSPAFLQLNPCNTGYIGFNGTPADSVQSAAHVKRLYSRLCGGYPTSATYRMKRNDYHTGLLDVFGLGGVPRAFPAKPPSFMLIACPMFKAFLSKSDQHH
eukprot:6471693-Amphidinium_carterae.2